MFSKPGTPDCRDGRLPGMIQILVIEPRTFYRNCISKALQSSGLFEVLVAGQLSDVTGNGFAKSVSVILLCVDATCYPEQLTEDLSLLGTVYPAANIAVMSDDNLNIALTALGGGAKSFIPASTSIDVMGNVLLITKAGGTYAPASAVLAAHDKTASSTSSHQAHAMFTARQLSVIDALRKGKSNKAIAYELNMCESTVKVHVRNILKRLNAKNRTQAVYLARELFSAPQR
jgi:DNA-binding NarL/FixJ family response regulator